MKQEWRTGCGGSLQVESIGRSPGKDLKTVLGMLAAITEYIVMKSVKAKKTICLGQTEFEVSMDVQAHMSTRRTKTRFQSPGEMQC